MWKAARLCRGDLSRLQASRGTSGARRAICWTHLFDSNNANFLLYHMEFWAVCCIWHPYNTDIKQSLANWISDILVLAYQSPRQVPWLHPRPPATHSEQGTWTTSVKDSSHLTVTVGEKSKVVKRPPPQPYPIRLKCLQIKILSPPLQRGSCPGSASHTLPLNFWLWL
jgi:hypothetical protein